MLVSERGPAHDRGPAVEVRAAAYRAPLPQSVNQLFHRPRAITELA